MAWISVDDKLPELKQGVLVAIDNGFITIGYRTKDGKFSEGFQRNTLGNYSGKVKRVSG